jgi:hypothetical protein
VLNALRCTRANKIRLPPSPVGHAEAEFCVSVVMKKCPGCFAIMKETTTPLQVPQSQQKPSEPTPEILPVSVRYECTQCGHMEEELTKPGR